MNVVFELVRDDITPTLRMFAASGPNIQRQLLGVMAAKFKQITIENFGYSGKARSQEWKALSKTKSGKKYQRKVGRSVATLEYDEDLFRSFRVSVMPDYSEVSSTSDYAATHQFGDEDRNIPARPFAPTIGPPNAEILNDYAAMEINRAVNEELQALFEGRPVMAVY